MIYLRYATVAVLDWLLGPAFICPLDGTRYRSRKSEYLSYGGIGYVWASHWSWRHGQDIHCYPVGRVVRDRRENHQHGSY